MKAVSCYGFSRASHLFERLSRHTQEQNVRHLEALLTCQLQDQWNADTILCHTPEDEFEAVLFTRIWQKAGKCSAAGTWGLAPAGPATLLAQPARWHHALSLSKQQNSRASGQKAFPGHSYDLGNTVILTDYINDAFKPLVINVDWYP